MSSRKVAKSSAVVLSAVLLMACGPAGGTPRSGGEDDSARLTVVAMGQGPMYVEGALRFVALARGDDVVFEEVLGNEPLVRDIEPGDYTLSHWARPCDPTCEHLDPPTDRCAADISAHEGEEVEAVVQLSPEGGCRIAIASA